MPSMDPDLRRTLLALTFVTGIVDAVTFLGLGQVFAAMQTGNVIFLGLGIAGAPGAPFLAPLVAAVVEVEAGEAAAYALIALLALAMGLRNTVVRGLGGPNLATTVLNLTVSALTTQAPLSPASGADLGERAAALLAILAGAVTGALLIETSLPLPLAIAAAITLLAGLAQVRARRLAAT
jgi:uncharacterized membrane protein YoaK (UPF0700 family)